MPSPTAEASGGAARAPERDLHAAVAALAAARRGDPVPPDRTADALAAVDAALARHQDAVYAMCQRIVGDPQRAREIAQDAMFVAFRKLHEFRGDSAFRTWLLGIARFKAMRAVRKRRDLLSEEGFLEVGDDARPVMSQLRRHEREELVRQASLAVLDELEQEAVHLRYVEGLGQEDITRILELTGASGARGLLVRCRRKLKGELERRLAAMGHGTSFIRTTWS
jgi:RNA polymerase sigma-70 factor, ECF subfamily